MSHVRCTTSLYPPIHQRTATTPGTLCHGRYCEKGPTVYSLTEKTWKWNNNVIAKAALSLQLFWDPEWWPGWSRTHVLPHGSPMPFVHSLCLIARLNAMGTDRTCVEDTIIWNYSLQSFRAVFKWLLKCLVIGLEISRQFFNQSEAKPEPIASCVYARFVRNFEQGTGNCLDFPLLHRTVWSCCDFSE